ncbi:hypothetical protein [Prevotella amnii]|uniref:hypothetical protein n=1 Tax=Prevotella amnii TaxID=419005 RepID=UPI00056754CB|nr:hypothetical protein [Prevotella amnii]
MASIVKNEKGFKVIRIDNDELQQAFGSPGICDNCSEMPEEGYYIAVLNRWFCPVCYHEWIKHAIYYKEDKPIEERNYQYMTEMLEICKYPWK